MACTVQKQQTKLNTYCLCFQFVLAAVLAVAAAAPAPDRSYGAPTYAPKVYQILKQEAELRDDQSYDSQ